MLPSSSVVVCPVVVTLPVSSIVNVESVVTLYPFGATISFNVYVSPVFKPSII